MQRWIILGTTLALFGVAGCRPADNAQVQQQVQGMRQELNSAANQAKKTAADASLAGNVKAALEARKGLDARAIDVDARGSVVTLKGDVSAPEQGTLAEKVASETKGVGQVVNQLTMRIPANSVVPPGGQPGAAGNEPGSTTQTPSSGTDAAPQPAVTH